MAIPRERSYSANSYCREIADFLRCTPDAWTRGSSARTGDSTPCSPTSPWARQWCTLGLLERFIPDDTTRTAVLVLLTRVITPLNGIPVPVHIYNDNGDRSLADIVRMFDCAAMLPVEASNLDYVEITEKFHAAKKAVFTAQMAQTDVAAVKMPPNWNQMSISADPEDTESVTALNAAVMKLVPWDTIKRQIQDSLAA